MDNTFDDTERLYRAVISTVPSRIILEKEWKNFSIRFCRHQRIKGEIYGRMKGYVRVFNTYPFILSDFYLFLPVKLEPGEKETVELSQIRRRPGFHG